MAEQHEGNAASAAPAASTAKTDIGGPDPNVRGQHGPWAQMEEPQMHTMISKQSSYWRRRPYIKDEDELERLMKSGFDKKLKGDFCWSLNFKPRFYAKLGYEGFLPICSEMSGDGLHVLLPKLHEERCVLRWPDMHISKKAKKHASKYTLTVNKSFERVLAGIVQQHGENWFYPPIKMALRFLHKNPERVTKFAGTAVSFEVWDGEDLVAGEAGVVCGQNYTSYSGFFTKPGAGTVQICAMIKLLERCGFHMLDFGQYIEYKTSFGAKVVKRSEFLAMYHEGRGKPTPKEILVQGGQYNCAELIRGSVV
eukprot:m.209347 g.209347  ORF g.209347 m.209347 type:complete len:309 (-) comp18977_c0_seq2:258-1184(-)